VSSAVSYTLLINGVPASSDLQAAIQQIEVEDHADMADMFRLRAAIGVKNGCADWTVVDDELFPRLAAIKVAVTIGNGPTEPLIEAYVIETNVDFSNQPGQSVLNVVAMDPTVRMNLEEKVRPWPNMADSDIASAIFEDRDYGFVPVVEQTQPSRQEVDYTTMQRGTDIRFLQQLAGRNGYECYVEVNPSTRLTEGHFHPPRLEQRPQGVLSVNMGEATNVNSFSARYDMLRPTTAQVTGLDIETQADQPAQAESLAVPELGSEPSLNGNRQRRVLLSRTGLAETGELQAYAQAVVDQSGWAITADGELNTVAYGRVLRAKRPVLVRGAGRQFNGTYYAKKVLHTFTGDSYTQRFTLSRNATSLTGRESFAEDEALVR
jgi:phage protein D